MTDMNRFLCAPLCAFTMLLPGAAYAQTAGVPGVHGGDKVCHWNAGVVLSVAV